MANGTDVISVLVVEDDPDTRDIISQFLALGSVELRIAANRDEGVKVLDAIEPDIILLDIMMPGLSLENFIDEARRKAPDAKIILMSAYGLLSSEAQRLGLDYMAKPIEMELLFKKLGI